MMMSQKTLSVRVKIANYSYMPQKLVFTSMHATGNIAIDYSAEALIKGIHLQNGEQVETNSRL
jgi:hypothetical protein